MRKIYILTLLCLLCFAPENPFFYAPLVQAQEGGQVVFQLEKVRVEDLTGCGIFGDDCSGDNDEPYFPMIKFRSRLYEPGSTKVELANRLYQFASLDEDPDEDEGNEADIPADAGQVTFENVHLSTLDSIAEGDFPEILGVVVLGLENEHSFDEVRDKINEQRPEIENQLRDWIESGALVDKLATALDSDSGDGGGEPGDDEKAECNGLKEILDQIPGSYDSPEELDLLAGSLTGFLFQSPLAGLLGYALVDPIIQFFADDFVYAHIFVYVTARDPDLNLDIECNDDKGRGTLTIKMLQPQEYKLDKIPIIFKGDEGEWHVEASVTFTDVLETQPPPANCVSKYPLLTNRLYLPVVFQTSSGSFPGPTRPTTTKLQTIQYNVQFLTPWDEGEIPEHWPNTSERATVIGEALACFDIVALNETVNDTRRGQIIGTMQARAPFCPNFLNGSSSLISDNTFQIQQKDGMAEQGDEISGQSFFNFVDGPNLTQTPVITGWSAGLRAINENRGEPLTDDELTIVSRFPIVETNSYIYKNSYGIDGLAAKGVLHARIRVDEPETSTYVDVFATHLQAGHDNYKRCQVTELADFIYETTDPANPVLLLGDFNIDGSTEARADLASNYNYLMNILKNLGSGHNLQDTGLHLTLGTDHSDNPEKNRKKRIDHIFVSQELTWSQDNVKIVDFAGIEEKPTLSDHAAVAAILELPKEDNIEVEGNDLTIKGLVATNNTIALTIKNVGSTPINDAFWIDVYYNPGRVPSLNQPCNAAVAAACVVWGIEENASNPLLNLPLNPGETRTLTLSNAFFGNKGSSLPPYPVGVDVYALVDSVDFSTKHGAVLESREDNNRFGPIKSTASLEVNTELVGTNISSPGDDLPPRE